MTSQPLERADDVVVAERHQDVLVITINRPTKSNALNTAVFTALDRLVREAPATGARAVVVTGAGSKAFCAGADIGELAVAKDDSASDLVGRGQRTFDDLEALSLPTVAAINGVALGGGLELAMACDVRVAAAHATFAQPEITLANVPGWGATQRLPRLIGYGRASQLILTGERIDADQANAWGLVNWTVDGDDLLSRALDVAHRLAGHSSLAVDQAKRALRAGQRHGIAAGLEAERHAVITCTGSPDQRAATSRFLKRTLPTTTPTGPTT